MIANMNHGVGGGSGHVVRVFLNAGPDQFGIKIPSPGIVSVGCAVPVGIGGGMKAHNVASVGHPLLEVALLRAVENCVSAGVAKHHGLKLAQLLDGVELLARGIVSYRAIELGAQCLKH